MATDGEWKMKSIDSYLLREPEKKPLGRSQGNPIYSDQEWMRAKMMNSIARNTVAATEQKKKQSMAKSVIDAIFLRLLR